MEPPNDPNYHFTTGHDQQGHPVDEIHAIADAGSAVLHVLRDRGDARPAPGAKDYIAKYKGKFDQGWDKLREETLKRQIELGVVPAGTKLPPMPKGVKAWTTLSDNEKKVFARQMEVYAGFGEHTDHEDRPADHGPRRDGGADNTLFFYIVGDNGASAEGGLDGTFNELLNVNGNSDTIPNLLKRMDDLGSPMAYNHFAVAGRSPAIRRFSGASRWPRFSAARAMA